MRRACMVGVAVVLAGLALPVQSSLAASLRADFNGDGYGDLAVGAPHEGFGEFTAAGVVSVIYGAPAGLNSGPAAQQFKQSDAGGDAEREERFGSAMAAADFDGDGFTDLAVGTPLERLGSGPDEVWHAGVINIIYSSGASGLAASGAQHFTQAQAGGTIGSGHEFGAALAAGDFDGDGIGDLAADATCHRADNLGCAGAVAVLYGVAGSGLQAAGAQHFTQSDAGGATERYDRFGSVLAAGDFDDDGNDDLVVGTPFEDIRSGGNLTNAGIVNVLYGASGTGLGSEGAQSLRQSDAAGQPEAFDRFGDSLGAGDFDADGAADLAIGAPGDSVGDDEEAGIVSVLYGAAGTGLSSARARRFRQEHAAGITEPNDNFGATLAAGDFDADAVDDVAIAADQEYFGSAMFHAGAVNVVYGIGGSGLASARAQQFRQSQLAATSETADRFGTALTTDDFDGDGFADLAIGTPYDSVGDRGHAGMVNVAYGTGGAGLASAGAQQITQSHIGAYPERFDLFGFALTGSSP